MRLTSKQLSQRSEKSAAEKFKGRVQIASGALRHSKGDIKTDRYLIEDKITEKSSYSMKATILEKIRLEAYNQRRTPMLRVTLGNKKTYCVVEEDEMLILLAQAGIIQ